MFLDARDKLPGPSKPLDATPKTLTPSSWTVAAIPSPYSPGVPSKPMRPASSVPSAGSV